MRYLLKCDFYLNDYGIHYGIFTFWNGGGFYFTFCKFLLTYLYSDFFNYTFNRKTDSQLTVQDMGFVHSLDFSGSFSMFFARFCLFGLTFNQVQKMSCCASNSQLISVMLHQKHNLSWLRVKTSILQLLVCKGELIILLIWNTGLPVRNCKM